MKDKLLAALKLKYPDASDATLTRIADKKAGSVTEESQIQSVVDGITLDIIIQSETDARIVEANKKAVHNYETTHKLKDGKPVEETKPPKTDTGDDDTPKWAKPLLEKITTLESKLAAQDQKTKQQSYQDKLNAKLSEKKIPVKMASKYVVNDESELDTAFTEIETTFNEIRQEDVNNKTSEAIPGGGFTATSKQQVSAAIDSWKAGKETQTSSEPKK